MDQFLAAAVQMNSGEDAQANLAAAVRAIEAAAARGARLVVLPEMFLCLGRASAIVAAGESIPGPATEQLAALAARHQLVLVAGSIPEKSNSPGKVFNTCVVFGTAGQLLATYRKLHLFDVTIPGAVDIRESSWYEPGSEVVAVDTPCGRLGLAICYDLRFPELFRRLADERVDLCALPSAFTLATGRDHWEVLLRARAIENQTHIIAANQWGKHGEGLVSYGHSLIVDPWGTVLAKAADGPGFALAAIDLARQREVRKNLPALKHRRLDRNKLVD
ncbi:MAG: carbon-nitrogen hydrolase family protein [Pirellulales bacterium]|nr:carbon-nitrogen hydrolase family protein [Pirellulales bacterium]